MTSLVQIGRAKRVLGISLGERSLLVAEVNADGQAAADARIAEFTYPTGVTLVDGPALGQALGKFLEERGFSARRVIFGVPARWLIIKTHTIPPTDEESARELLFLHVSEEVASDLGPMVFDFLGSSSSTESANVLLVGLQKRWMDRLAELAKAGALKIAAVTAAGLAIGQATARNVQNAFALWVRSDGVELIRMDGSRTWSLRHIGSSASVQPLIVELRRSAAVGLRESADTPNNLVLWDDAGLPPGFHEALRSSAGMDLLDAKPAWVGATTSVEPETHSGLSAAALTLPIRAGQRPSVDFLHPRLAQSKKPPLYRRTAWLSGTAAVILLAVAVAIGDIAHIQHQIDKSDRQLLKLQPALARATPFVNAMQFIESFRCGNPRYIACLRDLDTALPGDGQTYLVSFNLQSDMRGEVTGRSVNDQSVLNLVDKLRADGRFASLNSRLDPPATRSGTAGAGAAPEHRLVPAAPSAAGVAAARVEMSRRSP